MHADHEPTRVAAIGGSEGLETLCRSLAERNELEVAHVAVDGDVEPGADVVLLELAPGGDPGPRLEALRDLTAAPVFLLTPTASGPLVEWALEAGIADVLVPPYDAGGVRFAIEKAVRTARTRELPFTTARVVTVFSPKGGTGKSAIASNLATALARRGVRRTLLVDLDLQFGDAAIVLGLRPAKTFHDLIASPAELDAEMLGVYTERHRSGLDVLAAPLHPEDAELVRESVVGNVLGVARSDYGAVVVDTAPFFHSTTLAALDVTDELLLVCTPDIPTVKNVRLALETLEQLSLPARVRVVLNRDGDPGGLAARDVAEALGRAPDIVLPFDPAVSVGVNKGVPAVLQPARGAFADGIAAAARRLFPEDWPAGAAPVPATRPRMLRRRFAPARS